MKYYLSLFSIVTIYVVLALSCASTNYIEGVVKMQPSENEIFAKQELRQYLKSTAKPTIVLRVPDRVDEVLEKSTSSQYYYIIEKVLAQEGFVVRDRALFQKVFDQEDATDYSKIKFLTDTDLILELVQFADTYYHTNIYYDKKNRKKVTRADMKIPGKTVEFKIINVKQNDLAGTFTFNYKMCTDQDGCTYWIEENTGYVTTTKPLSSGRGRGTMATNPIPYETIDVESTKSWLGMCTRDLITEMRGK